MKFDKSLQKTEETVTAVALITWWKRKVVEKKACMTSMSIRTIHWPFHAHIETKPGRYKSSKWICNDKNVFERNEACAFFLRIKFKFDFVADHLNTNSSSFFYVFAKNIINHVWQQQKRNMRMQKPKTQRAVSIRRPAWLEVTAKIERAKTERKQRMKITNCEWENVKKLQFKKFSLAKST